MPLRATMNGLVVLRAAIVAAVLGSILTLANQTDALLGPGDIALLPLVLVYATPFAVVAISQMLGARQALREGIRAGPQGARAESFLATAFSHGIAVRAVLLGLSMGSLNTLIVISATLLEHGRLESLPLPLLAQAYSLPVVFGVLSQALAYRRAVRQAA